MLEIFWTYNVSVSESSYKSCLLFDSRVKATIIFVMRALDYIHVCIHCIVHVCECIVHCNVRVKATIIFVMRALD